MCIAFVMRKRILIVLLKNRDFVWRCNRAWWTQCMQLVFFILRCIYEMLFLCDLSVYKISIFSFFLTAISWLKSFFPALAWASFFSASFSFFFCSFLTTKFMRIKSFSTRKNSFVWKKKKEFCSSFLLNLLRDDHTENMAIELQSSFTVKLKR